MLETLVLVVIGLLIAVLIIQVIYFRGRNNSEGIDKNFRQNREEIVNSLSSRITEMANLQQNQLTNISKLNDDRLELVRKTVEGNLRSIQEDNNKQLEQMRRTVDEKLHETLEKRLGESFKLVSERLDTVHKGLGEMQTLASGVGDLKKLLTNVKSRGYWGEIQLENILEQILSPEQYDKSVATKKNSTEFVEFAIKLPGKTEDEIVYLPIDSKFPVESYQRLVEAQEQNDTGKLQEEIKKIEIEIKKCAKDIYEKYINPPRTTDFGIMFLPIEGLYSEVIRNYELCEFIRNKYKILVTGPTTFVALLNSLQMGFRTLAIEKRSSEVWSLLGAVKTEFMKFGDLLDKTNKKLGEISKTMEDATRKSRTIEKKLNKVHIGVNEVLSLDNSNNEYEIVDETEEERD